MTSVIDHSISSQASQKSVGTLLRYLGIFVGAIIILFAVIVLFTQMKPTELLSLIEQYFGLTFSCLYAMLMCLSIFSIYRLSEGLNLKYWFEMAMQTANGISTIALTFTLLGISLGIGSLTGETLSPENIQSIISDLTRQFSIAFMTTVVGLPSAALIRAFASLIIAKQDK